MRSEAEFQRLVAEGESRDRGAERLKNEDGSLPEAVVFDGETWLLLEIVEGRRGPEAVLEQWDDMATVNPSRVSAKDD